jgi:general secretion pathway protein C
MTIIVRKYFWMLNLFTIALCALLAAKAVGHLVEANLPPPKTRRVIPPPQLGQTLVAHGARDITPILSRNIFCSTCEKVVEGPNPGGDPGGAPTGEPNNDAPVKTSLNIKLIATLISNEDKAWSYAAIQNVTDSKSRLFGIGAKVPGDATITDIIDRRVLLLNGNRNEFLDLDTGNQPVTSPNPRVSIKRPRRSMPGMEAIAKGIRKVGEGKYEIQRSALNKVLANTTLLARSARIVPSVRNGKPNGFKLYAIRPGSLYGLLGMSNGDTINAINGHPINTPDKALEIYTKLRRASHVSISFTRRGKSQTSEYNIR